MICPPCAQAAEATTQRGIHFHTPAVCAWPGSCTCQHGTPIEQDPNGDPSIPDYVDALPEAERRAAYERAGRQAPDLDLPNSRLSTFSVTERFLSSPPQEESS